MKEVTPINREPADELVLVRRRQHEALIIEYAKSIPHLERAAKEGYEVVSATIDFIANCVGEICEPPSPKGIVILTADTDEWEDAEWEERKAPRARAFEVFDEVKLRLTTIEAPECVTLELHRIARWRPNESAQWMTAIVVKIITEFWNHRLVVIPAE